MAIITGVDCSRIAQGTVAAVCNKRAIAGTNSRVILGNYVDIDRDPANTVETDNVISELTLKDLAYEFVSYEDTTVGSGSIETGTYVNEVNHSVVLRIFTKNEPNKAFVNGLINSTVFAIIENKEPGDAGEVKYEIYGFESGLKVTALDWSTEMPDSVVYEITLSSPDNSKESTLPKSVWMGSYAATEAALDALVTPPSGGGGSGVA